LFARDETQRQRLEQVIEAAEPQRSASRVRWRAAVKQRDRVALVRLAGDLEVETLPAVALQRLARDLAWLYEPAAAERVLRAGQERFPGDFWLNYNLGDLLLKGQPPRAEEAVLYLTAALALRSDNPAVHSNLGNALRAKGDLEGAIRRYRHAVQIDPDFALAHNNLGVVLRGQGQLDGALAEFRQAVRLKKDYAEAHTNLGVALYETGQLDEGMAEYRQAIEINKDLPEPHANLGVALLDKGQLDEALAEGRLAVRLKQDNAESHSDLGHSLYRNGELDEALAEFREAIRLQKDLANAHFGIANVLRDMSQLNEAIDEFQEAIRLKKDFPEALCNLGIVLVRQGQFKQAGEELRRGHQLGSRNPRWPYPSAEWLRSAERLIELDAKLAKVLKGEVAPADAGERAYLGWLCLRPAKQLSAAAARFYEEAFAANSDPAQGEWLEHHYLGASAAILASSGQGKDTDQVSSQERVRLRRQALTWRQADLATWRKRFEDDETTVRPIVRQQMQAWLADPDSAAVRDPEALARLPEGERQDWQKLWTEVEELFAKAGGKISRQKK
jgi:tetratricopeptide (TPR) repeat protein